LKVYENVNGSWVLKGETDTWGNGYYSISYNVTLGTNQSKIVIVDESEDCDIPKNISCTGDC